MSFFLESTHIAHGSVKREKEYIQTSQRYWGIEKNRYNSYQNKAGYLDSFLPTLKKHDIQHAGVRAFINSKPNSLHIL